MKTNLKYLLIPLTLYLLQGCCWTDHSDVIKEVAVPMQKELEKFYKENKHFPTTQERDEILERVGCEMEGNVCVYGGERLTLIVHYNTRYQYKIRIDLENTGCYFGIQYNGNHTPVSCATSACISLKQ